MDEIVHIIPLGYEFDRAVKPFYGENGFRANRVYLLSSVPPVPADEEVLERHGYYFQRVKSEFEKLGIKVIERPVNLINLLELIKTISEIVVVEKDQGNNVYINMSGAGRLTSVASTLVGMVHDVRVYYVGSDEYADNDPRMETHGYSIIYEKASINFFENFKINMPERLQLDALVKIMEEGVMKSVDLIIYLGSIEYSDYDTEYESRSRNEKTRLIMKLNRNVVDKLYDQGYIHKKKFGRDNELSVTDTGRYIANISGISPRKTD